jgi:hypothetical protein
MKWEISDSFCHSSVSASGKEDDLKQAVLGAADYAFNLLEQNIEDDSMFCLFDWDFDKQRLLIAVTDPTKKKLAKHTVELRLTGYAEHIADKEDQQEQIQLWVHNYITTAANFLQYSLVAAIIADGDTSSSILL